MPSKYEQNNDISDREIYNENAGDINYGKSWHNSITSDRRLEVVDKIIQAIFPNPHPTARLDKRMHVLVGYARKVEDEMFNKSSSRKEYYNLIAEKIYKIQEELKKKRRERKPCLKK